MLKVIHHPMSAGSRYVRLILAEYGQSVEFEEERTWLRRPQFMALNPAGTVPVLIDGSGPAICGAAVIGEYLDEVRGPLMRERRLMPENSAARAEVRRIVDWFLVRFEQEVLEYLLHERVFKQLMASSDGGGPPDSTVIRAGRANLKGHLKYAAWLANSRDWLAGSELSQADRAAAAAFSVLDYLGEISWEDEPALKDWFARIKSRPSFRPLLADKVASIPPAAHYVDLDF